MVRRVRWYVVSVARMERSLIRDRSIRTESGPGLRCASSGLQNCRHYPAGWNESARAIAQASRKRRSWVPSSSSSGRSVG
ncbi:hypothetical protein SAMN05216337_1012170 [Bradyrhizobium brasilense]|uniref:Uncharacterized protein n=1 Tax=Bradyrhizobium brasilense TaxID=1419277 RepID=A0A1G6VT78_9BRAD|nr:hypothetical protein SAMN05216337_1012170 [Bradyrhizobium brasilense]